MFNHILLVITLCLAAAVGTSVYYLIKTLRRDKQLISLIGLFFIAMGVILLVLDTTLIALLHGIRYIPAYLTFNRLVSDSGFAGRWVLTIYLFIAAGIAVTIYVLARNIIKKLNTAKTG